MIGTDEQHFIATFANVKCNSNPFIHLNLNIEPNSKTYDSILQHLKNVLEWFQSKIQKNNEDRSQISFLPCRSNSWTNHIPDDHDFTRTFRNLVDRRDTGTKIVPFQKRKTKTQKNPSIKINVSVVLKDKAPHGLPHFFTLKMNELYKEVLALINFQ